MEREYLSNLMSGYKFRSPIDGEKYIVGFIPVIGFIYVNLVDGQVKRQTDITDEDGKIIPITL